MLTVVDGCAINPCRNNAVCKQVGSDFACECLAGYEGILCEIGELLIKL